MVYTHRTDLKRIRLRCTFPNEGAYRGNTRSQQCKMIKILNKTRIVRIVSFQTSLRRSLDPRHYTSRPSLQMSDVEPRMSDVGCRISDVGCRISDVRCRMSNLGCRKSDVECRISDVGCWMSDGTYKVPQYIRHCFEQTRLKFTFVSLNCTVVGLKLLCSLLQVHLKLNALI